MKNSVIRLLALSTLNLIAVYAVANDANIPTSTQVGIRVSDRNICMNSQYTCVSSRGGHENLGLGQRSNKFLSQNRRLFFLNDY